MSTNQPPEQYTIRRKVLKIFGASFHVYDETGKVVGFCKQKALRLREDIRIYTDETMSQEFMSIRTQQIIDFSASYTVALPDGTILGNLRRKGMASTFIRDTWMIYDPTGREIATLVERGNIMNILRRYVDFVSLISPQKFDLIRTDGSIAAVIRQHFNLLVYRLGVAINRDEKDGTDGIDDLMILASACLIAAIEGRQN